jgi:hypothetical protein
MRIAAQVVPQIRTRRMSDAQVAERDRIRARP